MNENVVQKAARFVIGNFVLVEEDEWILPTLSSMTVLPMFAPAASGTVSW